MKEWDAVMGLHAEVYGTAQSYISLEHKARGGMMIIPPPCYNL